MGYIELSGSSNDLLYSTVRVDTNLATGTGFGFSCFWQNIEISFLVTNKHVIEGASQGVMVFTEEIDGQPSLGSSVEVGLSQFSQRWHNHPSVDVDIAVMPLAFVTPELNRLGKKIYFKSLPHSLIPPQKQLEQFRIFSEVVFIGYPNGLIDRKNLMPIMRRGTMATMPSLDYDGEPKVLIDASVFPGSSGSPVFIVHSGPMFIGEGTNSISFAPRLFFLGVIAEVMIRTETGRLEFESIPTGQTLVPRVNQMIDLGVVYRSSEVLAACTHYFQVNPPRITKSS